MHSASKESHSVFTDQYDFSTFLKKTVRPQKLVKEKFNKLSAFLIFFMFLLVWILVLKRKDWDIRPAGSGIYEKGTFTGRDFIPGSYPSLCFIPPSLRSPATLVLHECVTCLGKRDQLAPAPKKDYQKNITIVQPWCSPESSSHLVKATWGFSCVFAPIVLKF